MFPKSWVVLRDVLEEVKPAVNRKLIITTV